MTVPATEGFYMPAEWKPHERCWMAWPCREEIWDGRIEDTRQAYARVARAISEFESVTMIANPADVAAASLACGRGVDILPMDIDDSWMRDVGPTYVVDGKGGIAGCDWHFNAWGHVYEFYNNDARLAEALLAHQDVRRLDAPFVLEGGAIHTDGEGTLLTTESVLLNPNRNPGMGKQDTEQALCDWLGVEKIVWLPDGYYEDETDGHVDNIACFVRPGVVLAASCPDRDDPNYEIFEANLDILRASTDAKGRKLKVLTLDQPARMEEDGKRLSCSYVNFYIADGGIVMPGFDDRRDNAAYRSVAQAFPDHKVVQVPSTDIVRGGGCIHCITQQQPKTGLTP
jgi:agmatine deiminase